MTSRTRTFALFVVKASLEDGRWANRILPYFRARLPKSKRPLLTELVYGTIKMKLALDFAISRSLKKYTLFDLTPWIRTILRLATYQLLFIKKIPAYAVVSESVNTAKRFGHRGTVRLVNAVLRRIAEDKPISDVPWVRDSHPRWLYEKWKRVYGEERTIEMMEHNNRPASIYLRANTLRISRSELAKKLAESQVKFEVLTFPKETIKVTTPPQDISLSHELYYAQDFSTQVIPYLLALEEGSFFYDAAVAPGGKASHIYALLEGNLLLLGIDRLLSRLRITKSIFERLGVENYLLVLGDSARLTLRKKPDFTLLDVPCSGLGTLRRKVELKWRMKEKRIAYLRNLQREMLEGVAQNIPEGGVLVYATCSTEPEENELQVKEFLKRHREFILEDAGDFVPREMTKNGFLWIDGILWDSDFAFAARVRKKS